MKVIMRIRWVALLGVLLPISVALADERSGGGSQSVRLSNPLGVNVNSFKDVLDKVLEPDKILAIVAPLVTIMVLYGAFLMLFSAGNEEKISQGRKTILYAAIGFVVVLLSSSIVAILQNLFK